jgi:hypothetical protein
MLRSQLKLGDIVFCIKGYRETEFGRSYRKYANENNFLVHLTKGKQYKVIDIILDTKEILLDNEIERILIENDFGHTQWYNISRFDKIKEMRRQKLERIKNLNNGATNL